MNNLKQLVNKGCNGRMYISLDEDNTEITSFRNS